MTETSKESILQAEIVQLNVKLENLQAEIDQKEKNTKIRELTDELIFLSESLVEAETALSKLQK